MERPKKCVMCPYYRLDRSLEYYHYPVCMKSGRELHLSWQDRPIWCQYEEEQDDQD